MKDWEFNLNEGKVRNDEGKMDCGQGTEVYSLPSDREKTGL